MSEYEEFMICSLIDKLGQARFVAFKMAKNSGNSYYDCLHFISQIAAFQKQEETFFMSMRLIKEYQKYKRKIGERI